MSSQGQQGQQGSSGYYYGLSNQQQGGYPPPQQQPQQQPQQEPEWRCLKCGRYISSVRAEAEAHNRACNGRCIWVCKACGAEFEDSTVAEQHVYGHWSSSNTGNQTAWGA